MSPASLSHEPGYGSVAKILHWLIVLLLIAQFALAWTMPHIGRNTVPETLINLHFSVGVVILLVIFVRMWWRMKHGTPPMLDTIPIWQHWAAQLVHGLLYLLLGVIPLMGWASASGRGYEVSLFGVIPLPALFLEPKSPRAGPIGDIHNWLSTYVLLGLIALHVLAALYHHFLRRDATLRRMLPSLG